MPVSRRLVSKPKSSRPNARASFEALESRKMLTVAVWTGAANDGLFSDAANWQGNVAPTAGQDLDFPSSVANTNVTIDADVTVGNIEFDSSYTLTSSNNTSHSLTIDGNLTGTVGEVTFNNPVVLGQNSTFLVDDACLVTLNGVVSDGGDSFGIDKQGNGELEFAGGGESFTGQLAGDGGTIIDNAPLAAHIGIHTGTAFYGSSSVDSIDGFDGTFSPETFNVSDNATAPATLTVDNTIGFTSPSGATFGYDIDGPSNSSKVVVTAGTIDLADTTFSATVVNNYTPGPGDVITLLQNNTGNPITGTFLNLPQGATVAINNVNYTISYTGGAAHDNVILTAPGTATNPDITSHTTLTSTHGYTATVSVVATDTSAGGTADLTYTWTAVHVPSGAKLPTFSTNGKNASATTVARFYKDGTYNLECTVKDKSGNTATSISQVVVGQKATSIKLEPHGAVIAKRGTKQFVATILDQFGHPMRTALTIAYSVPTGGGTISASGLFTAGDKAEKVEIEAKTGTLANFLAAVVG